MSDTPWDLGLLTERLRAAREAWRERRTGVRDFTARELPSPEAVHQAISQLRAVLFPLRLGPPDLRRDNEDFFVGHTLGLALHTLVAEARRELSYRHRSAGEHRDAAMLHAEALDKVGAFAQQLPTLRTVLDTDVEAAWRGDPAAQSVDEVLLCYPGVLALIHHRLAHALYGLGLPLIARIVAEQAHTLTGIDIHPGAKIGGYCFIDHGTGVVIGETAELGERVRLYQAVTLGAKRFDSGADGVLAKGQPRHPIVEDDVVIYAGATVLGRITIGRGSSIGGNVWLTRSVPPGSQVTQARLEEAKS
jgi:serine O-acetyltransferase